MIATAYAVTVDGFIQIAAKAIRNPRALQIVWMKETTWLRLATHATTQGQFYIPCTLALTECSQLRTLVHNIEGEPTDGHLTAI